MLDYVHFYICCAFLLASVYNRSSRRPACATVFIVYLFNTIISDLFYLDAHIFFLTAIIFDAIIGLMLMHSYQDRRPEYIKHSLLILVSMCIVNIAGIILYNAGDDGYFYAYSMLICNCALFFRLMIATGRDEDGVLGYSVLGGNSGLNYIKILHGSKRMES